MVVTFITAHGHRARASFSTAATEAQARESFRLMFGDLTICKVSHD